MQQQIHSAAPIESLKKSAASVLLLHRWGGSCFRLWSKTWSWFRLAEAPAEKKSLSIPVTEIDTKKKQEKIVASSPDVVYFGGEDVRSEKNMGFRCRNGDLNNVLIESLLWRKLVFFCIFFIFFQDMFSSIRREWRSKICHTGAFQKIYCKPLQMGPFLTSFQAPN